MEYQTDYQVTVFGIAQEQRTFEAKNGEEVARRVNDALQAGLNVLVTQQAVPVENGVKATRHDSGCTCPMSVREGFAMTLKAQVAESKTAGAHHSRGCPLWRASPASIH